MTHPVVQTITPLEKEDKAQAIGDLLVARRKLSSEDRDQVLRLQAINGRRFGDLAMSLGLVQQADIDQALAEQFSSLYLDAGVEQYPPDRKSTRLNSSHANISYA